MIMKINARDKNVWLRDKNWGEGAASHSARLYDNRKNNNKNKIKKKIKKGVKNVGFKVFENHNF